MSQNRFVLTFDIRSEWHIGSGREAGAYADSLVSKDQNGLPFVSGKSIKGLMRQAFTDALAYGWLEGADQNTLTQLFGQEGTGLDAQGLLRISSASFSLAEMTYFQAHPEAKKHLYLVRQATAIDHQTGCAKEHSLRSIETVIPMTLYATLSATNLPESIHTRLDTWLKLALPLIWSVGSKRHRGMGDVIITAKGQC